MRQGLVAAIEEAEADDAVKAVVILCEGQTFFAGADITEFGKPPVHADAADGRRHHRELHQAGGRRDPRHRARRRARGRARLPLSGRRPDGEAGRARGQAGLLPGAGGTQRLPRVAGVRKALEMAATGNPIGAKEAYDIGLVDRLIEGDLIQHAVAYAEEVRDVRPLPKSSRARRQARRARANPAIFDEFRKANARKFRGFEAPEANIKAVEAAVAKPYAEGVIDERKLFMELMTGTQAQRAAIFLLRRAQGGQDRRPARGHQAARHQARSA